jgi:hypothetical protein
MTEQQREESWSHTAWLTAHVVNAGMNTKKAVQPKDVNPVLMSRRKRRLSGRDGFRELKGMLF